MHAPVSGVTWMVTRPPTPQETSVAERRLTSFPIDTWVESFIKLHSELVTLWKSLAPLRRDMAYQGSTTHATLKPALNGAPVS